MAQRKNFIVFQFCRLQSEVLERDLLWPDAFWSDQIMKKAPKEEKFCPSTRLQGDKFPTAFSKGAPDLPKDLILDLLLRSHFSMIGESRAR